MRLGESCEAPQVFTLCFPGLQCLPSPCPGYALWSRALPTCRISVNPEVSGPFIFFM